MIIVDLDQDEGDGGLTDDEDLADSDYECLMESTKLSAAAASSNGRYNLRHRRNTRSTALLGLASTDDDEEVVGEEESRKAARVVRGKRKSFRSLPGSAPAGRPALDLSSVVTEERGGGGEEPEYGQARKRTARLTPGSGSARRKTGGAKKSNLHGLLFGRGPRPT